MSIAEDISDMLFNCTTSEEVVMKVVFRCGIDVKKTPLPRGLAANVLSIVTSKVEKLYHYHVANDPSKMKNLLSSLSSVLQKTKMFEKLEKDDKVKILLDAAKVVYHTGAQTPGLELECLLIRRFGIEHVDLVEFCKSQPKDCMIDYFFKHQFSEQMIDAAHGRATAEAK